MSPVASVKVQEQRGVPDFFTVGSSLLRQNVVDDFPVDVGKAHIAA